MSKVLSFIERNILFALVTLLIVMQLFLFLIYEQYSKHVEQDDMKNLLIQQNMLLVQRIQESRKSLQQQIIETSHIPNSTITLTSNPRWPIQVTSSSLWTIYEKMKHQKNLIHVSIRISENTWLNIEIISSLTPNLVRSVFIGFEIFISLFLIIFLWVIYRRTIPLKIISDAAKKLGMDVNTDPLLLQGTAIACQTFKAINEMQNKIKNLIQERTLMLATISHDLRTPLTSMKLRSELIENQDQQRKNNRDIDEMEAMVAQILAFAKEDYLSEQKTNIDLTALLTSICHDFSDRSQPAQYIGHDHRIIYHGSFLALKRAFSNLIDNAIKYGDAAEVNLFVDEKINIIISDSGTGVSDTDKDKILMPFYRTDLSRARKKSGVGLGLAIARNIIQAHGGCLTFGKGKTLGLKIIIHFPIF